MAVSITLMIGVVIGTVIMFAVSTYVVRHMIDDRNDGGLVQFIIFTIGTFGSAIHATILYFPLD